MDVLDSLFRNLFTQGRNEMIKGIKFNETMYGRCFECELLHKGTYKNCVERGLKGDWKTCINSYFKNYFKYDDYYELMKRISLGVEV